MRATSGKANLSLAVRFRRGSGIIFRYQLYIKTAYISPLLRFSPRAAGSTRAMALRWVAAMGTPCISEEARSRDDADDCLSS